MSHRALFNMVLLHRSDIQKLLQQPKILRDQIIVDLPTLEAFRTGEIAALDWQHVNEAERWIYVTNSKKDHLYPVPLDWQLAQRLKRFRQECGEPQYGGVIRPLPSVNVKRSAWGKPISNQAIEDVVKFYAREAGIFNWNQYNPTLLRAYFAAEWVSQKRSWKMLQTIMRHNSLSTTMRYATRIIFWEDLRTEFDRIQRIPTDRRLKKSNLLEMLENPMAKQCMKCAARLVCRHVDEAVQSEWAEGCRFYPKIMEEFLAQTTPGVQQT